MVDLVPQPEARRRVLPAMFAASCRDAIPLGHVYGELGAGELRGVAVWVPPGRARMSLARRLRALPDGLRILVAAPRRFPRALRYMAAADALHPTQAHWYLESVGVDPAWQRHGVATRLLAPVLALADRRRESCYLVTAREDVVSWYRGLGFEPLKDDVRLTPGGPRTWAMWRPPRAGSDPSRIG
jgi:ribosomal protein S18 acetylase RimI-like enzyme